MTLTGENGILGKANTAKEKAKEEEGREIIKLAIQEMLIEKKEKGETLTLDFIGDHIHEKLEISENDVTKNGEPTDSVDVIYKDYEYEIDENFEVEIVGTIGEGITIEGRYELKGSYAMIYITARTGNEEGIKQIIKPNNQSEVYTNKEKEVNIEYKAEKDEEYKFIVEGNNGRTRKTTIKVKGIDHNPPNDAIITLSATRVDDGTNCTVTMEVSDSQSGISQEECKYIMNESSTAIGENATEWNNATAFTKNPEVWSGNLSGAGKTYYFHVLSVDTAGNKKENISEGIYVSGNIVLLNVKWASGISEGSYDKWPDGWSRTDNQSGTWPLRAESGKTTYMQSGNTFDLTNINQIQLKGTGFADTGSKGTIELSVCDKSGNIVKRSDKGVIDWYVPQAGNNYTALNLGVDVSELLGQYFIRITLCQQSGSYRISLKAPWSLTAK